MGAGQSSPTSDGPHSQSRPVHVQPQRAVQPTGLLQACCRSRLMVVEIMVTVFVMGRSLYTPLCEQYYYHNFGSDILRNTSFDFPNGSFCVSSELINNNTGSNSSYKRAESESNHLVTYAQIAAIVPSVLLTLILGPLTDKYGRKIGMLLPAMGFTLQGIFSIFIVKFALNPYYFILASFVGGMFGNFTCILAASFSYVADVSSPRWRSLRVGLMESALSFGSSAGHLLGGYWLESIHCNFIPPLCFFAACNLMIVLYVIFVIPESRSRNEREEQKHKNPRGLVAYIQGFKLYFGGLSLRSTWKLYVSTITANVLLINVFGAMLVNVYFLKALPFNFNPFQIGIYQAIRSASQALANCLLMAILVALSVGDIWLMIIATLFHCSCNVLVGFADKTWQLYAIASVKGIEGISWSGARGLMSKLVSPQQQGALFSMVASLESLASLLAGSIWPVIFPITLQHNMRSGMTYIFMAALGSLLLPPLISLLFLKKEGPPLKKSGHHNIQYHGDSDASESTEKTEYSPLLT